MPLLDRRTWFQPGARIGSPVPSSPPPPSMAKMGAHRGQDWVWRAAVYPAGDSESKSAVQTRSEESSLRPGTQSHGSRPSPERPWAAGTDLGEQGCEKKSYLLKPPGLGAGSLVHSHQQRSPRCALGEQDRGMWGWGGGREEAGFLLLPAEPRFARKRLRVVCRSPRAPEVSRGRVDLGSSGLRVAGMP